ncbi:MAG: hypothetical protein ABTQ34_00990 [Bdellovibrionales bacterium]
MKKFALVIIAALLFAQSHAVVASDWMTELREALANGNFAEINVIAANNPGAQNDIALFLLREGQNNLATRPDVAIRLFSAAVPFASQIKLTSAREAGNIIAAFLALARDPAFQKRNPQGASDIFTAALAMSIEPNIVVANPNLHNVVLADARDFMGDNPVDANKVLADQINLALQVGSPAPIGPRGVINPSAE